MEKTQMLPNCLSEIASSASARLPICLIWLTLLLQLSEAAVFGAGKNSSTASHSSKAAVLTEAHGQVYKRAFLDWEKEIWDEPTAATKGDLLHEGMQLGTGRKSWAQLKWKQLSTRAWENSVYTILPNQKLVYLLGGEMLYQLDKNRKDKGDFYVWTKLIQARVRGTTILFQCSPKKTRA